MNELAARFDHALNSDFEGYTILFGLLGTTTALSLVMGVAVLRLFFADSPIVSPHPENSDPRHIETVPPWRFVRRKEQPVSMSFQEKRLLSFLHGSNQQAVANRLIQHELHRGATGRAMAAEWAADRLERERKGTW